jgi:hypothetical protein
MWPCLDLVITPSLQLFGGVRKGHEPVLVQTFRVEAAVADLQERGDQNMKKRGNHDAGFKARVALEAEKGERIVSEPATEYGVHPTMIHQFRKGSSGARD